ncbi:MAG TPA: CDP-alcohol phosphatidyltransferase family protein [Terriglobales bacterium]|nr:CDP-alcohol phosphatidyltransferase family protein [Terriglobales bacterium]
MQIKKTDILLVPNLLTILRFLTYPFILYFLKKGDLLFAIILMVLAAATDVLDGFLARTLNQVSDLGKIIDPLVDKIGIGIFLIYAALYKGFPLWACILVIAKEVLILVAGLFVINRRKIVPVSAFWGKLNSLVWGFVVLFYILEVRTIREIFLGIGLVVILMTALSYGKTFLKLMRGSNCRDA